MSNNTNANDVKFTLPNGTRWIAQENSPLSKMLTQTMQQIMNNNDSESHGKSHTKS